MKNVDRVLRHVIVRTDLEQKRADKLAKRNPKKERVRPAVPSLPLPAASPASAPRTSADDLRRVPTKRRRRHKERRRTWLR